MDMQKEIDNLKVKAGYDGKPQQWQYGFDLACRELAKAQAVPDGFVVVPETNISFKDWISDHKNDYVHFGGYQERAHELANRAWNASANTSTPKDKVLMPKKLSTKHIDYVVKELAITCGISLIEEVYQCLIEAQEPAND